jgi:phospholipase/carboxylesterase
MKKLIGPIFPSLSGEDKNIICFLHGYGADGFDLLPLTNQYSEIFPHSLFFAPHAPFPCELSPSGKQWFSLEDRMPEKMASGAKRAVGYLDQYFSNILTSLDLSYQKLYIVGFSQGAMMALYYMLTHGHNLGGIVSFSGALINPALSDTNPGLKTPVLLVHGVQDEVVPFSAMGEASDSLRKIGISHLCHKCMRLGHGINEEAIDESIHFLKSLGVDK